MEWSTGFTSRKWARSSVWLEHRPFKPRVAGSNPVGPAFESPFTGKGLFQKNLILTTFEAPFSRGFLEQDEKKALLDSVGAAFLRGL